MVNKEATKRGPRRGAPEGPPELYRRDPFGYSGGGWTTVGNHYRGHPEVHYVGGAYREFHLGYRARSPHRGLTLALGVPSTTLGALSQRVTQRGTRGREPIGRYLTTGILATGSYPEGTLGEAYREVYHVGYLTGNHYRVVQGTPYTGNRYYWPIVVSPGLVVTGTRR